MAWKNSAPSFASSQGGRGSLACVHSLHGGQLQLMQSAAQSVQQQNPEAPLLQVISLYRVSIAAFRPSDSFFYPSIRLRSKKQGDSTLFALISRGTTPFFFHYPTFYDNGKDSL